MTAAWFKRHLGTSGVFWAVSMGPVSGPTRAVSRGQGGAAGTLTEVEGWVAGGYSAQRLGLLYSLVLAPGEEGPGLEGTNPWCSQGPKGDLVPPRGLGLGTCLDLEPSLWGF